MHLAAADHIRELVALERANGCDGGDLQERVLQLLSSYTLRTVADRLASLVATSLVGDDHRGMTSHDRSALSEFMLS